jgi:hypothetical protein
MSLLSRSAGALARSSPLSAPAASASLLRSAAISHRRFLLADSTGQHQQQPQRAFHRSTPSRQSTATPAASAAPKLASSVPGASGLSGATPDSNGDYDGAKLFASELSHLTLKYNHALQYLTVTMNRPDLHNAFNEVVIQELTSVFRTLESACTVDPTSVLGGLRAVVLTGAGVSFSAGADLNWMKKMKVGQGSAELRRRCSRITDQLIRNFSAALSPRRRTPRSRISPTASPSSRCSSSCTAVPSL